MTFEEKIMVGGKWGGFLYFILAFSDEHISLTDFKY